MLAGVEKKEAHAMSSPRTRAACSLQETGLRLPAVRRINLGGEPVSVRRGQSTEPQKCATPAVFSQCDRLLHQALQSFTNARVLVTYGPTEAAVDCTTWYAEKDSLGKVPSAVLGWPDAFRAIDVCDPRDPCGGAVPLGCTGELRIFGPGLAKGYVARAEETGKAFVSCQRAAGAQYRTGDAVRWGRICGLEFLGRLDAQAGACWTDAIARRHLLASSCFFSTLDFGCAWTSMRAL